MSNGSAGQSQVRRLIAGVALSVIRYGVPAWSNALEAGCNVKKSIRVHRLMCLRVASAFRPISYEAVCVIAGMVPINILLEEDVECFNDRDSEQVWRVKRAVSLLKWQKAWDTAVKSRWTHRLIPEVSNWISRKHGQVNFHLSQVLSKHGCFKKFLHRFGFANSAECPECVGEVESAELVMCACQRFDVERHVSCLSAAWIQLRTTSLRGCVGKRLYGMRWTQRLNRLCRNYSAGGVLNKTSSCSSDQAWDLPPSYRKTMRQNQRENSQLKLETQPNQRSSLQRTTGLSLRLDILNLVTYLFCYDIFVVWRFPSRLRFCTTRRIIIRLRQMNIRNT